MFESEDDLRRHFMGTVVGNTGSVCEPEGHECRMVDRQLVLTDRNDFELNVNEFGPEG